MRNAVSSTRSAAWPVAALGLLLGCSGVIDEPRIKASEATGPAEPVAAVEEPLRPAPAGLRTLTPDQYAASVRRVLGAAAEGFEVSRVGQWSSSIAAARGGFSPTTVGRYEDVARAAARHAFGDPFRRAAFVGCDAADLLCRRAFLVKVGRRAYRRPLQVDELARWTALATRLTSTLGDPYVALEHVLSGLLQSTRFLYRVELAEEAAPTAEAPERTRYSDHELASRLSYFLWGGPPDEILLDAVDAGTLRDPTVLEAQVDRMLADPRFQQGVEQFIEDLLQADGLDGLEKDERVFPDFSEHLLVPLRRQLVWTARDAALDEGFGTLFTTRRTYLNHALAPYYSHAAPSWPPLAPALTPVALPAESPRAGILATPGFAAQHAYPGKTSPALRGLFVRKRLLCQDIPPPPPSVVTQLPEPEDGRLVTNRELVAQHQRDPVCAGCHGLMDPIGLALETFDAAGAYRETHNDLTIDPSGELDGVPFADANGLGEAIADHPGLLPCMAMHLFAHAAGTTTEADRSEMEALAEAGATAPDLMRAIALSDLFRFAWTPEPTEASP